VNVSVSTVKVFIVVLIICCHSVNFMMRNETLVNLSAVAASFS
jgi:hypothetical protein